MDNNPTAIMQPAPKDGLTCLAVHTGQSAADIKAILNSKDDGEVAHFVEVCEDDSDVMYITLCQRYGTGEEGTTPFKGTGLPTRKVFDYYLKKYGALGLYVILQVRLFSQ